MRKIIEITVAKMKKKKLNRVMKNTITLMMTSMKHEEKINKKKAETVIKEIAVIKMKTVKKVIKINYSFYNLHSFQKRLVKHVNIIIKALYAIIMVTLIINDDVAIKPMMVTKKII